MKTLRTIVVCNVLVLVMCTAVACHRSYYRRQADAEAMRLIEEKSLDPHWSLPGYTIEIDPASRMFDPFSQDHPPMPPDDPSAAEFMREVDGKPGFPHWNANGNTPYVENPEWRFLLPVDEEGKLVVDIETAVELALLHSPDYQRELEDLYLSALAVSLERFDFETQFFMPLNSNFQTSGTARGEGSTLGVNNGGNQLRKAGITGSNLIVSLANSIVWQYSGADNVQVGFGSLSMELIQPLLRRAGRDVILEALTDAERGLLYNVRQLERFRRGYMQQISVGFNPGGDVVLGAGPIAGIAGVARGAGGVLGLLQTQQNIRILEGNIVSQRKLLEQFDEFYKFERIDLLQLKQFKRNLFNEQSNLLSALANYQNNLDDFKIQLGLPPDLEMEISDPILDEFILIDEKITRRQEEVGVLRTTASDVFLKITDLTSKPLDEMKVARDRISVTGGDPATDLSWTDLDIEFTDELRDRIRLARETLQKIKPIYQEIIEIDFPQTEKDIERLQDSLGRRKRALTELNERYFGDNQSKEAPLVTEKEILDIGDLDDQVSERLLEYKGGVRVNKDDGTEEKVVGVRASVQQASDQLDEIIRVWGLILENDGKLPAAELEKEPLKTELGPGGDSDLKQDVLTRAGTIRRFISEPGPEVLTQISNLIVDVSLIQALARVDSLTLPVVDITWQEALELARFNRRDWMNARAQLVDQWRNIEVIADDLESQLDLTFGADLQNLGDNPLKLRGRNGQIRIGLQFDAPITRLAERNNYRTALINYQRTKRRFYRFEDEISAQLREIIRLIEVFKLNFEIARIQVKNSVDEVQLASYELVRPPQPGSTNSRVGGQTANNLIFALRNLLANQNSLINNWVQYEVLRRQLDFNMGTMQLDEQGYWIDPVEITNESIQGRMSGEYLPGIMPVPMEMEIESPDTNVAPDDNIPPVSRRNGTIEFSQFRSQPDRQQVSRPVNSQVSSSLTPQTSLRNTADSSPIAANPNRGISPNRNGLRASSFDSSSTAKAGPPKIPPRKKSLYSNFDSDLRRVRTTSVQTELAKPSSSMASLPAGKKIVDRKTNSSQPRNSNQRTSSLGTPRINPFPFSANQNR